VGRVDGTDTTTLRGSLTVAAVGDCIVSRPLLPMAGVDRAFAEVVSLLRGSDATFGNLETSLVDLADTAAVPSGLPDDWAIRAVPDTALDLRALGFDVFARANNHSTDWGAGGMFETGLYLDEAALLHAGAGPTLAAARAPRYLETDAGRLGPADRPRRPRPRERGVIRSPRCRDVADRVTAALRSRRSGRAALDAALPRSMLGS